MSSRPSHRPSASRSCSGLEVPVYLVIAGIAGIAAVLIWVIKSLGPRASAFPQSGGPPIFESPTLPLPPPKALAADTVDEFVQWVAAVPVSDAQRIRDAIAVARGDDALHSALLTRLFTLPVQDFGRHHLLLSVIGELRRPDSADALIRFVHLPGDEVLPMPPRDQQSGGLCTSHLDYCAGLQARAVEMLAHLRTSQAFEAVLSAASVHPSRVVRLAALDSYLFNHDDDPQAVERARAACRPEETKFVGLPRRTSDGDPEKFEAQVRDFYRRYPDEVPPRPYVSRSIKQTTPTSRPTSRPSRSQYT